MEAGILGISNSKGMVSATGMSASDANVEAVRLKLRKRAQLGLRKYGVTTERNDFSRIDWLRHAQEEAMDLAIYLEVLIHQEESAETPQK
jgi:hypothetical protein